MTDAPTLVAVGNALVDHTYLLTNVPSPDGGAFVLDREDRPGGVETNVAVVTDALGVEAGIIARLGDDADADAIERHLAGTGVDHERVRRAPDATTSYCLVLTTEAGERIIIGGGDSTLGLALDGADLAYLREAGVTFASAYAPAAVIERLAALDTPFAFDLAGQFEDLEHRGLTRAALDDVLGEIDLFVANVASARSYLERGGSPRELAATLRARGAARGAITSGAEGALLFDADDAYFVDPIDVDVVDTTGAGDAFTAGLVRAWLLEGREPPAAGRYAAAAAALNCTSPGAQTDPPTADEVAAVLD